MVEFKGQNYGLFKDKIFKLRNGPLKEDNNVMFQ